MNFTTKLVPKLIFKDETNKANQYSRLKLINKNLKIRNHSSDDSTNELNQSWDFTPFPKLFFPSEKKYAIRAINRLNFKNTMNLNTPTNTTNRINILNNNKFKTLTPHYLKSNSVSNLFQEIKGDITKYRPPAFSFGISREECKIPFLNYKENINPCPGSYNLRPLLGLGGHSLKYSINKKTFAKNINSNKNPGPGHYNIDKCDTKFNGNIILSNFPNSPICNFSKYKEKRDIKNFEHSEWNIKPEPSRYNINSTLSMFNGTGKYPLSVFKSNISKSINRSNSLSRIGLKFVSPGPGEYNHHSIFMGHKY